MLRALGRASCIAASSLEASATLHAAAPPSTLGALRLFASGQASSNTDAAAGASGSAPAGSSSKGSGRLGGKQWRSWIDTKLDSKLEAIGKQEGDKAKAAPRAAAPAAPIDQPRSKVQKGWVLEQQIYDIVAPARTASEEGTLPEGVTNIAQLAMASDAPRFARSANNVADISPLRIHPTRLFFPQQSYAPSELDPYKTSEEAAAAPFEQQGGLPTLNPDEVTQLADYKNAPMLSTFLSEAGKLPLRQRTHLRAKLHRHLARQVKIARCMGILSPTARWEPSAESQAEAAQQVKRQRQQRRRQHQQQQQQRQ